MITICIEFRARSVCVVLDCHTETPNIKSGIIQKAQSEEFWSPYDCLIVFSCLLNSIPSSCHWHLVQSYWQPHNFRGRKSANLLSVSFYVTNVLCAVKKNAEYFSLTEKTNLGSFPISKHGLPAARAHQRLGLLLRNLDCLFTFHFILTTSEGQLKNLYNVNFILGLSMTTVMLRFV